MSIGLIEALISPTRRWKIDALRNMGFRGQGLQNRFRGQGFLGKLPKGPLRDIITRGALPRGPLRDMLKGRKPKSKTSSKTSPKRKRRPKDFNFFDRDITVEI